MEAALSDTEVTESENESDSDTCDETEINKMFLLKCHRIQNKGINKSKYVLHIDAMENSTPNIIIGLSDNTAMVYKISNSHIANLHTFGASTDVTGVKACIDNENLFYISSKNCEIHILDLRDPDSKTCFKDTTLEEQAVNYKPLNCFDVAPNNVLLCGGTDSEAGDSYILFWDIRNTKLLGAYWDSHTDDITQVKFHPSDVNKLISGSTDGLINIFDLSQTSEDDALVDSLNTESSVEQLLWYNESNIDMIGCATHISDIQVWRLEDSQPYVHFRRDALAKAIRRKSENHCYVASLQKNKFNKLLALIGSNYGDGECLRAVGLDNKKMLPLFDAKKNQQRVRCSWLNRNEDVLITGGENGKIDIWNVQTNLILATNGNKHMR